MQGSQPDHDLRHPGVSRANAPAVVRRPTAATRLMESVRYACARIEGCARGLALLEAAERDVTPWQPRSHGNAGGGGCGDPTASLAVARIEGLAKDIEAKRAEYFVLEHTIGKGLKAIESVRRHVSERAANVLDLYYVDRLPTWSEVGEELGISRSTVQRDRDRALDWIDEECDVVV